MSIRIPDPGQLSAALDVIVASQQDPRTACAYLGTERAGIQAELEDLSPGWAQTARVAVRGEEVVAVVAVDYDEETGRSWIQGPWAVDEAAWNQWARPLLDLAIEQTPEGIDDHEISADPVNLRLAALADRLGWHRSVVNIAYVARSDEGWPGSGAEEQAPRRATSSDLAAVREVHDEAFPGTYASARALVEESDRITLVLDGDQPGQIHGYASAEVQADGGGYLDFLAIRAEQRGRGLSRALLAAIGREILAAAPSRSVNLTVKEDNLPAIALYESFGFTRDAELIGYRSQPYRG